MPIPAGIIVGWPSTVASIPAGWVRETSIDTKYVRGAAAGGDSDLTGFGATTHVHTEAGHVPVQNSHTHNVATTAESGSRNYNIAGFNVIAIALHNHGSTASDPETATNNSGTATLNTASNDPPFRKVIWIRSDGTPTGLPDGCYAFFDSDTLPSSWARSEGNNFLKGADAAGSGTGVGGASDSHLHTESGTHSHSQNSHTHTGTSAANDTNANGSGAGTAAADGHIHTYTLNATTATNNASSISLGTSDGQPVFKKLNIIKNNTGGSSTPDQVILIWNSTNGSIPTDYARYTAMDDFFCKGCNANGEVATTGGAAAHNHTGTCTTTSPTHTHTITAAAADTAVTAGSGTAGAATTGHTHTWTISSTTITHQNQALTINNNTSETNYPEYVKIIFVKFTEPPVVVGGGARRPGYYGEYNLDSLNSGTYGWLLPR